MQVKVVNEHLEVVPSETDAARQTRERLCDGVSVRAVRGDDAREWRSGWQCVLICGAGKRWDGAVLLSGAVLPPHVGTVHQ